MGNHRFRLSDMMPNAWFYKLRDMSKSRIHNPNSSHQKKLQHPSPTSQKIINSRSKPSYQLQTNYKSSDNTTTHNFPYIMKNNNVDPPTKSSPSKKKKPNRKTIYKPSPRKQPENSFPVWLKPPTVHDHDDFLEESDDSFGADDACDDSCCTCKLITSSEADDDIIIDVDGRINLKRFEEFNVVLEQELPQIRTKPAKVAAPKPPENDTVPRAKKSKKTAARKSVSRVKIRGANVVSSSRRKSSSVKLGGGGDEEEKKKGLLFYNSESFAIVKASFDPEADFRESMMEMIVENNIRASKELEDLLACYLSLNSNQYHDLIVKAFEQIWFNMPQLDFN